MSLKCMPLLFLNMAGEMAYILQQRLQAQNVSKEKAIRVLTDILHTMFNKKFMEQLFKPQHLCTRRTMRIFFEKLAHSSIMRLNETSMDKLYDLMTMAYKYQLQLCNGPEHLVLITLNHLDCVRQMLPNDETLSQLIDVTHQMVISVYYEMPVWEQALTRSCLLNFFQDTRIKVSLLLRCGKQTEDGHFVLFPTTSYQLPYNGNSPGRIRYFEKGEHVRSETFTTDYNATEYIETTTRGNVQLQANDRGTKLGINMYTASESLQVRGGSSAVTRSEGPLPGDELKLLSALIISSDQKQQKGFDLNLFTDELEEKTFVQERDEAVAKMTHIDARKHRRSITKAVAELKMNDERPRRKSAKGEDVLNLLDEASKRPATRAKAKRSISFKRTLPQ